MPRVAGSKDYSTLVKGLITEASDLGFPEGATSSELNFLLDSAGVKRVKRKGLETQLENDTLTKDYVSQFDDIDISEMFFWENPGVYVLIVGDTAATGTTEVYFLAEDDLSLIDSVEIAPAVVGPSSYSSALDGNLLVLAIDRSQEQFVFEHKPEDSTIEFRKFWIYLRDQRLVPDGLSVTERPSSLSNDHEYNLYNAGWWAYRWDGTSFVNPITEFFNEEGEYPSNADQVYVAINLDSSTGEYTFRPQQLSERRLGSTEAPRGHYVYRIDNVDREFRRNNINADGVPDTTTSAVLQTINL